MSAHSVALAGFGIASLIEIGASTVVLWELSDSSEQRQRKALHVIGYAFSGLALYLIVQIIIVFVNRYHPQASGLGIIWTAKTAGIMFMLARGKKQVGEKMQNAVLITEGKVTMIDGLLACAVLLGLLLNYLFGWWYADPLAGVVIIYYAVKEANTIFFKSSKSK